MNLYHIYHEFWDETYFIVRAESLERAQELVNDLGYQYSSSVNSESDFLLSPEGEEGVIWQLHIYQPDPDDYPD
jgi:hypothetical protein